MARRPLPSSMCDSASRSALASRECQFRPRDAKESTAKGRDRRRISTLPGRRDACYAVGARSPCSGAQGGVKMFELIHQIPEPWRQLTDLLIAPLAWIPRLQHTLWDFFFAPGPWWLVTLKYLFLVFPALLAIAAVWCTQLSIYTLPFRSGRAQFIPTMMLTWWDAVRAIWLYWVGMVRFVAVALGWVGTLSTFVAKFLRGAIRQIVILPLTITGPMTSNHFSAGAPLIAIVMLI